MKENLDYFLQLKNNFLVIEAKNDDLTRGFTQLAVELIALSQVEEQDFIMVQSRLVMCGDLGS